MSPVWSPPYKIRRSTRILSFAVRQNYSLLNVAGETCYLMKRFARADETFQKSARRVSTLTKIASAYETDPDTGDLRYLLWQDGRDLVTEYPDIGVFTCTVQASASTSAWEYAIDKYSFINNRQEYTFDIYRNEVDSSGDPIPDAIYIVFNTPPMHAGNVSVFNFGTISPAVSFESLQPVIDNQTGFQWSLFGFEQWLKSDARIRGRRVPHSFLVAFPGVLTDFVLDEAGFMRHSKESYWTTPPPYSPEIVEHDMIIRPYTGQRFQVIDYTPIYIESILCSQHFGLCEIDPRSSLYSISYVTG